MILYSLPSSAKEDLTRYDMDSICLAYLASIHLKMQLKGSPGKDAYRPDHVDANFYLHILCRLQNPGGPQRADCPNYPRQVLVHPVCRLCCLVRLPGTGMLQLISMAEQSTNRSTEEHY